MSPHSSPASSPAPVSAERRREILRELADVAAGVVNKQLDGFATRLAEALQRVAQLCVDPEQGRGHATAAALLKKNRYPFCYVATERLAAILHDEITAADDPAATIALPAGELKRLEPDVEVDKKLCLMKAARAIERDQSERYAALSGRLAVVLGRDELPMAQNPFRPQVFLGLVHDAWCEFQPHQALHHLVFPLLGSELCLDMGSVLHALNTVLTRRGIAPIGAPAKPAATAAAADAAAEDDPLARQLRRLFPKAGTPQGGDKPLPGAFPSLFENTALNGAAARTIFLDYVTGVHKSGAMSGPQGSSLLAHLRDQAPTGSLTDEDRHAVDLLIKIFDAVFCDKNIPGEITALIGSLQVPVLKAALLDKDFFFKADHPARRVIDLMARLALGWHRAAGSDDPVYQVILRNVKRIYSDQRAGAFAEAEAELDAFIRKEEASAAEALSSPISQALQKEKMLQAAKDARNQVALRVGTGEVVAFVETFLEDKWVSVLTLAYSVRDEKPQAVQSAVQTMDDLIWSVKPKISADERKEMLAKLPQIIAMLNKWLDAIKWNEPARAEFFNELARTHASIVRAPLEMSPQRRVELAIEAAQRAAERRMQKQEEQARQASDGVMQRIQRLERGTWVEFKQASGIPQTVKLAWVSPMRSLFIFANRQRQAALSLSDEQLARAFREGRATVVLEAGVVGRALQEALGANGAAQSAA